MSHGIDILIAEDSPTQAAQLQHILESHNYGVLIASNGRHALALLRRSESKPALVISDITMPEMNGYELCREIKADERLKDIPVMLLTSLSDPHDIISGLECGADNFLTKPYGEKLLLSRIQYILINREARRGGRTQMGMEIFFGGQRLLVTPERQQILDLLIGTYETAVQKNLELQRVQGELKALNESLEERVEERTAALITEMTERQRAEESIARLSQRNDLILNSAGEGIYGVDLKGCVTFVNPAAAKMFGWNITELIGESQHEILHHTKIDGAPYAREDCQIYAAFKDGRVHHVTDEVFWRKDGTSFPVEYISTPIREGGEIIGAVVTFKDITARKRAEVALRESEEQLRQSQKLEAIGQLAGGVAHDFNNLLTVIGGYSSLLLRSLTDDEQRQKVEEVKKAGERAASLTRQLLAFSRKQVLQPVVLNLNDIVPETDKMLRRLIGADIELLTELEPDLWQVKADAGQVEQVLMNLAVNARDAMPKGGKLVIQTANVYLDESYARQHLAVQPGPYVMLAVSDTGCGMDAETQAHIFEPFFTTKEAGKGTGLGLSTVYGIVNQSDGNIWVNSEVGRGTTFKIYLPRVFETIDQRQSHVVEDVTPRGFETILLLEDEEAVRHLMQDILEMNGYRVLAAASGSEALKISGQRQGLIDLLITDIVMPQMGGPEVAARLTLLRPEMKILFMSGYTGETSAHHGVLDARVAFLEKPFTPDAVARKVREVLDAPPLNQGMMEITPTVFDDMAQV